MHRVRLQGLEATKGLAQRLARQMAPGDILLIDGELGAGKTTLVRSLVEAFGGDPALVASPTFTLCNQYQARLRVAHVDAYRLDGPAGLVALGFDEQMDGGIGVVEWGERVSAAVDPRRTWRVRLSHAGDDARDADISAPVRRGDEGSAIVAGAGARRLGDPTAAADSAGVHLAASDESRITSLQKAQPARIERVAADAEGGDPLVRAYLDRFRATCAWRTIAWAWVAIGFAAAVVGAILGNQLAGGPDASQPLHNPTALMRLAHGAFGNPTGCVLGMLAAASIASGIAWMLSVPRRGVPAVQEPWLGAIVAAALWLAVFDRLIFASIVTALLAGVYIVAIGFRVLALALGGRAPAAASVSMPSGGWPMFTVLVPLYRERNVAKNILVSLARLEYPRDRLDVKFLLEADDPDTFEALKAAGLPPWAEIVVVPHAQPKTKPRACNHGLARAKGELLVIYDAEDRPDPDQLKKAASQFARLGPDVVCLQAQLAYHNHDQNLLTRWFALEYNVWFRAYLAGLERLGVPIPLGGTSNHFRVAPLTQLGGWDPFNVTEDCDLGVRLRIAGHRTRMLDSTTWEEANSRVGNWLRQRSRWLKGYLVTHLVWFRRPVKLVCGLGLWATLGFVLSVFCVAALAAVNLVLWTVAGWYVIALCLDLRHHAPHLSRGSATWELVTTRILERETPDSAYSSWQMVYHGRGEDEFWAPLSVLFFAVSIVLLLGNLAFIIVNAYAGRRPGQKGLWWAALLSPAYWVLISLAAWKGIWQLLTKPHYWEKTVHGLDEKHGS